MPAPPPPKHRVRSKGGRGAVLLRPYKSMKRFWHWLLLLFSLWIVWGIRAHHILALPVFVDESLHIMRAQVVYQFTDAVASFLPGKLLTYYYFGLFDLQNHNALWLARQAVALLAPLSAALCFALTYHFTRSYWAGIGVIWIYALNPLLMFFERMALSDPFVAVFSLGLIWASLLYAKHPSHLRAIAVGALLGLAMLAKLTALPLGAVPILALFYYRRWHWQRLVIPYMVTALFLLLPAFYVVYQEVAQLEDKQEVVTTTLFVPAERSRVEQIGFNLQTYGEAIGAFSPPMVALWIVTVLVGIITTGIHGKNGNPSLWYLLPILVLSWGFIILTSAFPSTRYLAITFALCLVMIGLQANIIWRVNPQFVKIYMGTFVVLVGISSLAFIQQAWANPSNLQLGDQDQWEYFTHSSSGYGLWNVAPDLLVLEPAGQPVPLLSTVGSCHSIRFYLPQGHPIKLYCPYFGFWGNPILLTRDEWQPYANSLGYTYLLTEDPQPSWLQNQESELLATYLRPHDGESVYLFKIDLDWTLPDEQP